MAKQQPTTLLPIPKLPDGTEDYFGFVANTSIKEIIKPATAE